MRLRTHGSAAPETPETPETPAQGAPTDDVELRRTRILPPPAEVTPGLRSQRWHYRRSLASRVTLLTTIAVGMAVTFLAVGAYVTARVQLQQQLDDSLLNRARLAASANLLTPVNMIAATSGGEVRIGNVRVYNGMALAPELAQATDGPALRPGRPELEVAAGRRAESVRTMRAGDTRFRVVAVPVPGNADNGIALVFAQSLDEQNRVLSRLGTVMLVLGLLGVLGAGVAGWFVASNGLRPVRRLTSRVEDIARTEDLRPMPVEGHDEVARLASAFNQMLASLDASRDRQRRLVTDAGHELRTPLTSLRTNVDLLTQVDSSEQTIDPAARTELLADIGAQIVELTTLIGDLTELARDEPLAPVVGRVDLGEIVDQSVSRVRRRAPSVSFDVATEPWGVVGEASALERAVTNLLDNAAKWSPPDGVVTVRLTEGELVVDDQGPGIAAADRPRVFDRFWRASESRTMPGSGLGLAIVSQVVERHSGTVEAHEAPGGGARLVMRLPGRAGG